METIKKEDTWIYKRSKALESCMPPDWYIPLIVIVGLIFHYLRLSDIFIIIFTIILFMYVKLNKGE